MFCCHIPVIRVASINRFSCQLKGELKVSNRNEGWSQKSWRLQCQTTSTGQPGNTGFCGTMREVHPSLMMDHVNCVCVCDSLSSIFEKNNLIAFFNNILHCIFII
ncbi:Protein Ycf2 [Frankliniella fusca]|uniref:Protein Ycf2 n=1 Tax=Frankliniella fusca TaxID=407009 RepID=A0AAE1LHG1_9NEOP|nr:Protein Ycf2 [Frankliniella fusca]